ncbi:hypothetical protein BC830DRAFT_1240947, partial [Chytriomyces sp. MP71]
MPLGSRLALFKLKPVMPDHVLMILRRVVPRFADLTVLEVNDMMKASAVAASWSERGLDHHDSGRRDGLAVDQTVLHVRIRIMPRHKGDWADNNHIYPDINRKERDMDQALSRKHVDTEDARKIWSREDMEVEAAQFRVFFN